MFWNWVGFVFFSAVWIICIIRTFKDWNVNIGALGFDLFVDLLFPILITIFGNEVMPSIFGGLWKLLNG